MSATKVPNYTEEQTAELVKAYNAAQTDEDRANVVNTEAARLGKTVRSIRQKLVREGVYVRPERKTKSGTSIEKKAQIVEDIASAMGCESEAIESLEKGTKTALELVRACLFSLVAIADAKADTPE